MSTEYRCDYDSCNTLLQAASPLGVKRMAETLTEMEFVDDYLEKEQELKAHTEGEKLAVSVYKSIVPEVLKTTYYNNILDSLNIEVNEALKKVKDAEEVLLKATTHLHALLSKSKIALKAVDDHWKEREVVVASVEDTPLPPSNGHQLPGCHSRYKSKIALKAIDDHWKEREVVVASVEDTPLPPSPKETTSAPEVLKESCIWAKWDEPWSLGDKSPLPPSPKESKGPSLFPFMLKGIMYKRIGYLDDGDVIWQEDNDLWYTTEDETLEYGSYAGKLTYTLTLDNSPEVMEKEPDIGSNLRLYE
jgi:hypothetical protein